VWANGRWTLLADRGDYQLSGRRLWPSRAAPLSSGDANEILETLSAAEPPCTPGRLLEHLDGRRAVTVSGHQPSYHPYMPLMAKAAHSDVFTFADDMAFGRQKFQHRQRVPAAHGRVWITVPVEASHSRAAIGDRRIRIERGWQKTHWEAIQRAYGHLPHFAAAGGFYEQIYAVEWTRLAALDEALWLPLARQLAPGTVFLSSRLLSFDRSGRKGDRIAAELRTVAHGGQYLAGAACQYLDEPSDRQPFGSYADSIRSAGFQIFRCTLSTTLFAEATPTAPNALALELVAREGPVAREILRACTHLEARDG
jgi:WbqC-like protein